MYMYIHAVIFSSTDYRLLRCALQSDGGEAAVVLGEHSD